MDETMMQGLTEDGRRLVADVAGRHGVSTDAVYSLLMALAAGGGSQAQFNHPELGGMGQWSQGGMIMVGDMFNNGLKFRVDALCNDLAGALRQASPFAPAPRQSQSQLSGGSGWASLFVPGSMGESWPAELGAPASTGSQNDLHYAVFPGTRRLAIRQGGHTTVYDTGDHQISGFSQQQSGDQSLTFTSQYGLVRLADLAIVPAHADALPQPAPEASSGAQAGMGEAAPQPTFAPSHLAPAPAAAGCAAPAYSDDEIFSRLERLAELRKKDVITAEEFDAKKAELLARL
jgi:hypothetical protein